MKIGITGGAGFIGQYVAVAAINHGHEVAILDRMGRPAGTGLETRFLGDVRDATDMTEFAAHVDGIIHLAACLGTQETITNPLPATETNVGGGLNFLQACAQYDIPGVYIGVGNHWMQNTYSITKTTVERFVEMFNADRGTRVNVVRLVNAYGPGQSVAPPYGPAKVRKITPAFVCRALVGAPIEVYGDGSQVSDMVHVRDGAEALVRSLEAAADGVVFDRPVEVGSTHPTTVLEMAEIVRRHAVDYGMAQPDVQFLPMRPGETVGRPVVADTSTLEFVGMDPEALIPLEHGIAETVRWYAQDWLPGFRASRRAAVGRSFDEVVAGPEIDLAARKS